MSKKLGRSWPRCLQTIAAAAVISLCSGTTVRAGAWSRPPTRSFAPVALRGYGTVSGSYWELGTASLLEIDCESADTAKLTHAKYLSDIQLLPTVKQDEDGTIEAADQGVVRAYLDGNRVLIFAGKTTAALNDLVKQVQPNGPTNASMDVPMWLDRWDRFNFRHYYGAWSTPKGVKLNDYNFAGDFDWAQKQDQAGILLRATRQSADTADNMMDDGWARYVVDEAASHHLPADVHLSTEYGSDPLWFVNRFRSQCQLKMPGFTGDFHVLMSPNLGGGGVLSWNSTTGQDSTFGLLREKVEKYGNDPNVTSFLEPHNETHHGVQDLFMEYGPVADAAYQKYLEQKYKTVHAVAQRWQRPLASWGDMRVPQLSSFAGDSPEAIDVGGLWHVKYEDLIDPVPPSAIDYDYQSTPKSTPAPNEWYQPDTDDSSWPLVPGGGNYTAMFLKKRPAVYRRTFDLPADWKQKHPRTWLYFWDLNFAGHDKVRTVLNGKEIAVQTIGVHQFHWEAIEVTDVIKPGKNLLAVRVPQGYIEYKTYLSPVEAKQYPDLGEGLNAQWVDFIDFTQYSRVEAIRRGMEMIRQAAPHQGITIMHPDEYSDGLKALCVTYGGEFHNTGYMGAFWADYNTSLSRGADLPYSLEPGSPEKTVEGWKHQWGLYQTEGVQACDYFIHLGDILWQPDIKADYEAHRKQIALMGQSHFPKAQIAVFYSDRLDQMTNFPWQVKDPNSSLGAGYWKWNAASVLRGEVPYDGLSQSSFVNGEADPYSVVIDSNTEMMDPEMVDQIEQWVRKGGTFVTLAQTGRSTPEKIDAWPIEKLTGYHVVKIDHLKSNGQVDEQGPMRAAAGQAVYGSEWNGVVGNGLHMKKTAADTQDLLMWGDGTVAAGVRQVGKGYIVQLGAKFTGASLNDRIEPKQESDESRHLRQLLLAILKWRNIAPEPGKLTRPNDYVMLRHGVTNNGLFDTWTLWNRNKTDNETVSASIGTGSPTFAIDMLDQSRLALSGPTLENIEIKPNETRVFLTPIQKVDQAPLQWFDLQRKWWRGVGTPNMTELPIPKPVLARNLTEDWKFKPLADKADATQLLAVKVDDGAWATRPMGAWDTKVVGTGHAVLRKEFTVPSEWNNGPVSLWITAWNAISFIDRARVWLDGTEVKRMSVEAYRGEAIPSLKPGSTHVVAVEVDSPGSLAGTRGQCWISYEPLPPEKIDLAGEWKTSPDALTEGPPVKLPGHFQGTYFMSRSVFVDEKYRDKTVMYELNGDSSLVAALINGILVRRNPSGVGNRGMMNVTPFIQFGKENTIQIVRYLGPGNGEVKDVCLGMYDKNPYGE